jgi:hypothetical protein
MRFFLLWDTNYYFDESTNEILETIVGTATKSPSSLNKRNK